MKNLLLAFLLVLLAAVPVSAQEDLPDPEPEVSVEAVPLPGGFGDWWLQNVTEKFELFMARTEERKVELEEKFAARREAQLEKLEALPDDHPRKEMLVERLEERYQKHLSNIEERANRLTEKKQQILDRLEIKKERFETVKEFVTETKEVREQNREEFRLKLEDIRNRRKMIIDEFKEDVKDGTGSAREDAQEMKKGVQELNQEKRDLMEEKKVESMELRTKFKERMEQEAAEREVKRLENAKPAQVKFSERVQENMEAAKQREAGNTSQPTAGEDKVLGLTTTEHNQVLGAQEYQPEGLLEKIGWWLAGR